MGYKFNPFTGTLDIVGSSTPNFSYNIIASGVTITIPVNQQMIVHTPLTIVGDLKIEGEVFIFDPTKVNRLIDTATSESINIELYEVIRQTTSGITTTLTGAVVGSVITITNRSGADCTIGATIQGTASPTITDLESFSLIYNGTDYDIT